MVQHPCLVMPRSLFLEIEGEDEELVRGLDPVLRKKVRDAGRRVAIIADTWVYHLIPDGFWKVMRMYYRNGRGSGFASKNYPDRVLELSDGYDGGSFDERKPFFFRVRRRFLSLAFSLLKLELIKMSADVAYIIGVLREKLFPAYDSTAPAVLDVVIEEREGYPFKLSVHRIQLENA